jgi:membrane protease YdiL (CAAX protease family)
LTAPAKLWVRTAGEVALAGSLLAVVDVSPLEARLPLLPALLLGALTGIGLVLVLARGLPPPLRVDRARIPLVSLKGGVLALGSGAEEVIWRWFAIGSLTPAVGVIGAYVASTIGFAAAHVGRRAALVHLLTGASFGAVYLATGRLAAAAAAHVAYNLRVLLAVESTRPPISIRESPRR